MRDLNLCRVYDRATVYDLEFMTLAIEYFNVAGTATAEGVFIPVSDLPGVTSSELLESTVYKEGKVTLALLNRMYSVTALQSLLGFAVTKEAPDGVDADIFNQTFLITYQKLVKLDTDNITIVPLPTSGANSGVGGFSIADIFPGAVRVSATDAVTGAGIVINTLGLAPYSSLAHADINVSNDSRAWFYAVADHLVIDATKRSASVSSSVVTGIASSISASGIPADYIATTDPVSGIVAADVRSRGLINRTDTITIQVQLNQTTQTFDVLVTVTA